MLNNLQFDEQRDLELFKIQYQSSLTFTSLDKR